MDTHFKKTKFVNFGIIHLECRGDPLDPNDVDKTVCSKDLKGFICKDKIVASAIKSNRKGIHIEKNMVEKHLNNSL